MNTLLAVIDFMNLILSGIAVGIASKFVLRTEKSLDKAAKLMLGSSLVAFAASIGIMNKYVGIISPEIERTIYEVSRVIFLLFFVWALYIFLGITETGRDRENE